VSNSIICPTEHGVRSESTASLELRALRKMITARCAQIERLVEQAVAAGGLGSRESDLQYEVFTERRAQAQDRIENEMDEPPETRAARLERILNGLECSWAYFGREDEHLIDSDDDQHWEICVK
jgi:hypothetical protein